MGNAQGRFDETVVEMSSDHRILIATDVTGDAELVRRMLANEFSHVDKSVDPDKAVLRTHHLSGDRADAFEDRQMQRQIAAFVGQRRRGGRTPEQGVSRRCGCVH